MTQECTYRIEYRFPKNYDLDAFSEMSLFVGRRGEVRLPGEKAIVVQLWGSTMRVQLIEDFQDHRDERKGDHLFVTIERGWLILKESFFYLDTILPPKGSITLLDDPKWTKHILGTELVHALVDGDLIPKIAKNCVDILLPLICERSPSIRDIFKELNPVWMKEPEPKKKAPAKKKAKAKKGRATCPRSTSRRRPPSST